MEIQVLGMTCAGCEAKVSYLIKQIDGVQSVETDLQTGVIKLSTNKKITIAEIQKALSAEKKYSVSAVESFFKKSVRIYTPLIIIIGYITLITLFITYVSRHEFSYHTWMRFWMGGFFLTFSLFKMINLSGFAKSFSQYDVLAKHVPLFAYSYPFIELILGLLFVSNTLIIPSNIATIGIYGIGLIGILNKIFTPNTVKCACLGDNFSLPVGWVTFGENITMILMGFVNIYLHVR